MTVGASEDLADARTPLIIDVAGLQVAIIAVAENEFSGAGENRPGANPFDPLTTLLQVADLRQRVPAVLVLFHCGSERYPLPSPGVVRECRALVDAGASAVVCCHTHVAGGVEEYRGSPIIYGLGNFLFPPPPLQEQLPAWYEGYCASITFVPAGAREFRIIPFRQEAGARAVLPLSGDEAVRAAGHIQALSAVILDGAKLAREWSRFCRTLRADYVAGVFGLTRVERALLRRCGLWPSWRVPRRRLLSTLNLVRCESHREVLLTLLEEETAGKAGDGVVG
jgi:poly-gamma-glutamate synthesis protein (capsule biosynthesis protein)